MSLIFVHLGYTTSKSATYSVNSNSSGYAYISVNSYSTSDYSITGSFNANSGFNSSLETESNGSTGTANLLTANVQMTGQSSSSSDYDFYKLFTPSSGTAQFNLTLPSSNYSSYYIDIYDSLGTLQKSYTTSKSATIPVVNVGNQSYNNVVITVGNVVRIDGGIAASSHDTYNAALNQLSIPSVKFNGVIYNNVVVNVGQIISVDGVSQF